MIRTMEFPATPDLMYDSAQRSTARALMLEPRRAVLQALRAWATEHEFDAGDLAAIDRVLAGLAAAEDGPDLDLVMRTVRRRVIVQARQRRRNSASGRPTAC